ncbi:BACON domain-containing protein [Sphingobacterium gobiense]|uniref:BACON domain-containing protein n=1 Tax=Sphingobacterium gobiense TaxID=1382456 RepID=A0A2S9JID0_9SPHI|nr:BACON domain-containing carbohydrate-binding protein [Sphingobacterium gobiense]PRD52751.1 hypothetical protein C5749_16180 [Sphingobacterium gobiense]
MNRYMNYRIGVLLLLLLGICFSCSKIDDLGDFNPQDPDLSLATDVIEVSKDGGAFTINVESNLPWRAKSSADWISLSSENALATGEIAFNAARNRSTDQRSAEITVWITKDYEKKIRVIQAPAELSDLITHYYVKVSGTDENSGLSWNEATTLEKALDEVIPGDVIHIAAGTYTPTKTITGGSASNSADKTFEIHSNISLIGGYSADATEGEVSDPTLHETVLSGNTASGKVYHTVAITAPVQGDQKVVLQGLSIKYGQAANSGTGHITLNGAQYYRFYGGGLIVARSVVDIIDCEISENTTGFHAAGVFVFSGAIVRFERSTIKKNNGTHNGGNGGGVFNEAATVYFNDCEISSNTISGVGAGIYAFSSSEPTYTYIYNTTVAHNNNDIGNVSQTRRGGGIYGRERSVTIIVNSTFYGNTGGHGAGISLYGTAAAPSRMDVISSTVTGNQAFNNGGGVELTANTTLNIFNSIVSGNTAGNGGDIFAGSGANPSFSSSVRGNQLLDNNGAVIDAQTFDFETMLGNFTNNGGYAETAVLSSSSPAAALGMSATQLENLGNTFNPAIPPEVTAYDQNGKSRSGAAMGAAIP